MQRNQRVLATGHENNEKADSIITVGAVLAGTAEIPEAAITRLTNSNGDHAPIKVCGYGFPSENDALRSRDRRVTMVYQGSIQIDYFNVFVVPIPDVFRYARGTRKIIVSLAYDPPVRRRRLEPSALMR